MSARIFFGVILADTPFLEFNGKTPMLHLLGMAVVTAAGVATANMDQWPKLKHKAVTYSKQVLRAIKDEFETFSETRATQHPETPSEAGALAVGKAAPPETLPTALKYVQHKWLTTLETQGSEARFAFSTTTMFLALTAQFGIGWLMPVSLLFTGFLGAPIFESALAAAFREKRIRVDMLDAVVIALCILFQQFGVAAFMVWVLDLADLLLEKTSRKSQHYLANMFGEQARHAWVLVDGAEIEIPLQDVKHGDLVVVKTGDQVPIDGAIIEGQAMIDQQSLTGEAAPAEKHVGDEVFAMTVLVAGKITVKVQHTGEHTLASRIVHIIQDASQHKVAMQSVGERIADRMVLPTLGLGALGYATNSIGAMLAIINADYGTGIRVAAPIALLASLGNAAKHGVLIKDSNVFELLPKIDVVLFDKTGTLTYDVPVVSDVILADREHSAEKILAYTAAVEQNFSHPIAKAILQKVHEMRLTLPAYDESRYDVGLGIEAVIDRDHVRVGSSRYMEMENIPIPDHLQDALGHARDSGHSAILTAINHKVAGIIELQSTLRDEAIQVLRDLRRRGMKEIVLISGDHEAPTREFAQKLRADRYFAGVLPHEKAGYVRMLQHEGKTVMMVGDGINDSAALSCADISVSLQGASTIAMDVADVVFMDGNLEKFDALFQYSEALARTVRRSFQLIAIPNTFCIAGALMGVFGLSHSLVLNNGFNVISALNGMSLYGKEDEKTERA